MSLGKYSTLELLPWPQPFILQLVIACQDEGLAPDLNVLKSALSQAKTVQSLSSSQITAAVTFLRQARCLEPEHNQPLRATALAREAVNSLPQPEGMMAVVQQITEVQVTLTEQQKRS